MFHRHSHNDHGRRFSRAEHSQDGQYLGHNWHWRQVAGAYSPSPGVIYPTLTLLDELGYVTVSTGDGAKKLHEITAEGRAFLDANRRAVDALLARMAETSRAHGGGPAPQILRAMENLKLALRLRLSRGPLSEEQINAVAAAIDAAATGVEQI